MQNKFYLLLILSFLLQTNVVAENILTDYRIHGIENIEKHMDRELANKEYWTNYLRNIDTTFGYIETYSTILKCDKTNSMLNVYRKDKNNKYLLSRKYSAYTGKNKGNKSREGDLRTPTGLYNITKKISNVDSFYGPLALVTSYPNSYDKYKGKNGHGIWIHGVPNNQERKKYTKGCIAIQNKSIECLDKHIDIKKTLLIIDEKTKDLTVTKKRLAMLLSNLYAWRYAWLYSNLNDYLNYYSTKFIRFDGISYNSFKNYKKRIFKKKESKKITFTKINVIPYPDKDNIFQITFMEHYKSDSFEFNGEKILIVELVNNTMKILTEK